MELKILLEEEKTQRARDESEHTKGLLMVERDLRDIERRLPEEQIKKLEKDLEK